MKDVDCANDAWLEYLAVTREDSLAAKRMILDARIEFGRRTSDLAKKIPSRKLLGKEIARRYPASQEMDIALRSNCKWLYEALNHKGHGASDILSVLGVLFIYDVGSENPTTIRREYCKAKKRLGS